MHCIIVLATLFVTSCYWSAVPANTLSPQVLHQLNITLTNSTDPLGAPLDGATELKWDQPIQLLSRCWCDFTRTPLFDVLDVQVWEKDSLLAHPMPGPPEPSPLPLEPGAGGSTAQASELEEGSKNGSPGLTRRLLGYVVPKRFIRQHPPTSSPSTSTSTSTSTLTSGSAPAANTARGGGFLSRWLQRGDPSNRPPPAPSPRQPPHVPNPNPAAAAAAATLILLPPPEATPRAAPPRSILRSLVVPGILLRPITHWRFRWPLKTTGKVQGPALPWLRRRYDLSRHGIGIVLDFGWGRGAHGGPIGPA